MPGDFPHGGEGGADGARGIWTFDHDIGAWQADEGVELGWSSVDAAHSAYSGSLAVTNAAAASADAYHSAGASVCVNARGGTTYDVSAELEIDGDQRTGSAGFAVEFFNVPGCEGLRLGVANYLSATTSRWVLGERTPTAPAGSQSALFHHVASKLGTDPPFTVRFDDVRFRAESE